MRSLKIVGIILFLLVPSLAAGEPVKVVPPQNKILSSGAGRYVFGQISDYARHQFMLDTQTGRLWQIVVDKEKVVSLDPVKYQGAFYGEMRLMPDIKKTAEYHDSILYDAAERDFSIKNKSKKEEKIKRDF